MFQIEKSHVQIDSGTGHLSGPAVVHSRKCLLDVPGLFTDRGAYASMEKDAVIYEVQFHNPVPEGTEGGLYFGTSTIHAGKVGAEYYMTKGHFHNKADTAEYYWGISGEGCLLLMDMEGVCRAEQVTKGSLHYIPGRTAHRLVNTGKEDLVAGACWPSDAGHDYRTIEQDGFTVQVMEQDGKPVLSAK